MTSAWSLRLAVLTGILAGCLAVPAWAQPVTGNPASTTPATPPPPEIKEVKDAIAAFQKLDFDGALKALKTAVSKNADLPPAQVLMAQLFAQANQAQGVRTSLERAIIEEPTDPEAIVILADFALRESRVTEAGLLYAEAGRMMPGFTKGPKRKEVLEPRVSSGLAAVAEARGDWPLAQKHLEATLKLAPKDAMIMQRIARAMFQQKSANDALQMLRQAYGADKTNVLTPEATLATFYEQYGDHKNAQKWMGKALVAAPKDLKTLLVAGQWCLETNQIEEAQTHASNAMQADPASLEAKVLRGVVALFLKDYKGAETYFEAAHLQSPSAFPASNNLALALCEQPNDKMKLQRAVEYATTNARQYPKAAEAASTYGWVLYKAGQLDQAEQALRQAAQSGNISSDTAYYLAQVSFDRGRKDDAKQLLQAALKNERPFSKRQEAEALLKKL